MGSIRRIWAWGIRQLGGRASAHVVAVFGAVFALDSADKGALGAMAVELQHSLRIGTTELGLLVTVTALAGAIGTLPFGWLVDRTRRTRVLALAVLVWAVAMLVCASAISYAYLLAARVVLGVITAAGIPAIASLTGDYFLPRRRGRIFGYILAGEFLGTGFGFLASGELALGYYFFAGIRTFGVEFMTGWFHLSHSGALWVTAGLGGGALIGVLFGGRLADSLLAHRILSARVLVATIAYLVAAVLLLPALRTHLLPVAAPSRSTGRFSSCSSSSSSAAASASSLSAPAPATSPPPKPTPAVRRNGTGTPEPALPRFRFLPRSLRGIG
jgi:predicted MFS family arabinose efflux permease